MTFTPDQLIALLPLLITAGTVVVVMLAIAFKRNHWWNATISVVGLNAALLSILLIAPNGLENIVPQQVTPLLIVDGYACFYMALILISTLACMTLAHAYMEGFNGNREEIYLLLGLACAGGLVLACSRHLAGLFIGLELLSVPVYGMVAYTFRQNRSLEAGIKYMVLSAAASAFLLFGMALLYAYSGSLAFSDIGARLSGNELNPILLAGGALIVVGLGFKLSLAPFHLWTPDVYQGAPAPVGAFLATASKVAVFAVLLRFIVETPAMHSIVLRNVFAVLAAASIIVGNLLALTQPNLKRLLGYSSIAHFGYVLVAIVAGNAIAIEAVGVYLFTYVVTTLAAFGAVSLISSPYKGTDADALYDIRGLFWRRPYLAMALAWAMLSLAGIPATAGFIGKFYVVAAGVDAELWWLLGLVVIGSAIGLYYYLRVMVTLFLLEPGMRRHNAPLDWGQRAGGLALVLFALLTLYVGVYPQPLLDIVQNAAIASP
ncbi:MAG: NADH-quinone oxidoreductase subunit NuoN [Spongiibacteraceae bacterium]